MTRILITGSTASQLDEPFFTRRLCLLDSGFPDEVIVLFELSPDGPPGWPEMKRRYESALEAFDRDDVPTAARLLGTILADHPSDQASMQLLAKINAVVSRTR